MNDSPNKDPSSQALKRTKLLFHNYCTSTVAVGFCSKQIEVCMEKMRKNLCIVEILKLYSSCKFYQFVVDCISLLNVEN